MTASAVHFIKVRMELKLLKIAKILHAQEKCLRKILNFFHVWINIKLLYLFYKLYYNYYSKDFFYERAVVLTVKKYGKEYIGQSKCYEDDIKERYL